MKVRNLTVARTDQPCKLHACLRHALRLARWTGFFPVQGLGQTFANKTKFKIKCIYFSYYISSLVGQMIMSIFSILYFFDTDIGWNTISNIIFYVTGFITAVLLLNLSRQWPQLMAKATETEQSLTELKFKNKTVVQTTVIAYGVMALALIEHILYTSLNIKFFMNWLQETGINANVMENYVIYTMPYVFNYIPYSAFSALMFEYMCLQATFLWSFSDVMITCFSIYITAYFRSLNTVIAINARKTKGGIPWSVLRIHYSNLVKLIKEIDLQISSFILMSFFNYLFYICLQLFNLLHRNHVSCKYCNEEQTKQSLSSPYYLLYYLYSFIFLVLRALMLSIFASNVHCAGLEPIYSVHDVPSSVYDIEVRRFQLQLNHTNVALSGKFFYVTRNMILKVVGTIITYEIVLLQYSITPATYFNSTTTTVATIVENITGIY